MRIFLKRFNRSRKPLRAPHYGTHPISMRRVFDVLFIIANESRWPESVTFNHQLQNILNWRFWWPLCLGRTRNYVLIGFLSRTAKHNKHRPLRWKKEFGSRKEGDYAREICGTVAWQRNTMFNKKISRIGWKNKNGEKLQRSPHLATLNFFFCLVHRKSGRTRLLNEVNAIMNGSYPKYLNGKSVAYFRDSSFNLLKMGKFKRRIRQKIKTYVLRVKMIERFIRFLLFDIFLYLICGSVRVELHSKQERDFTWKLFVRHEKMFRFTLYSNSTYYRH